MARAGLGDGPSRGGAQSRSRRRSATRRRCTSVTPAMIFRKISVGVTGTAMPAFASTLTPEQRWNVVMYLEPLHHVAGSRSAEGEGLYFAGLHVVPRRHRVGRRRRVARSLTTLPPELGSFAWQVGVGATRSIVAAIRAGIPAIADAAVGELTPAQVQQPSSRIFARCRCASDTLAPRRRRGAEDSSAATAATPQIAVAARSVADRGARWATDRSRRTAPSTRISPSSRSRRRRARAIPASSSSMERLYAEFKGAIKRQRSARRGRVRATRSRRACQRVVALTQPAGSGLGSVLAEFSHHPSRRLRGDSRRRRRRRVPAQDRPSRTAEVDLDGRSALALVASALTAVVLRTVLGAIPASAGDHRGRDAAHRGRACCSRVSYWLISRVEAAKWQQFIREKVNTRARPRRRPRAGVRRVPRRVSRGRRDGAVLSGAVQRGRARRAADHARHHRRASRRSPSSSRSSIGSACAFRCGRSSA